MIRIIEGLFWITVGIFSIYTRFKSPTPEWTSDTMNSDGKLLIGGIGGIIIGILILIGKTGPIIGSLFD